ncbi:MAG TPA: hypothetical protein DEA22_09795 [Blastocatellia bacterium]|nr:hypothetical protein [Blastocatellia bacterium]
MNAFRTLIVGFALIVGAAASASAQTSLTTLGGTKIDVQAQDGKVVILAVGARWLPLSNKQAAFTEALAKKYAGRDVVVYFVAADSTSPKSKNYASNDELREFAASNKLTVTILRDPDGAATLKKFGIDQLPSFVILDKRGSRVGEPFSGIDPKFDITVPISKTVDRLLQ